MNSKTILAHQQFALTLTRLAHQIIENHPNFNETAIIGLQPKGIFVANRLQQILNALTNTSILTGALDITFFRDDFRNRVQPLIPSVSNLDFSIENKNCILVDDVLFTGRTARAAFDALLTYGRPKKIEFLAFIDRRFTRQIPIQADYVGKWVDSIESERVIVKWKETDGNDEVILLTEKNNYA